MTTPLATATPGVLRVRLSGSIKKLPPWLVVTDTQVWDAGGSRSPLATRTRVRCEQGRWIFPWPRALVVSLRLHLEGKLHGSRLSSRYTVADT